MTGAYRELPYEPDSVPAAIAAIIDAMGMDLPVDALGRLLRNTRHAHRMVLSDWLRRNDPTWKPPERLPDLPGEYDYGDLAGVGLDDWDEWYRECWGRPRANPGKFRGTDIAMPPLVSIYHLVNRFWRGEMGLSFRPNFVGQEAADTDAKRFPELNAAAQIFLLVAQDAAPGLYNCDLCSRVNNAYYKRLNRTI